MQLKITHTFTQDEVEKILKREIINKLRELNKLDALIKKEEDIQISFHEYFESGVATATIEVK